MNYSKQMSSAEPGLILILIDQSGSMSENYVQQPQPQTKAEFASMAVNRVINEIINANADGVRVKDRCFIAVIGYGSDVSLIKAGMLEELANNPEDTIPLKKREPDGAGGIIEIDYQMPIWVKPKAENTTPMHTAFAEAKKVVSEWIGNRPEHAAPIVINITDGMPNEEPATKAEALSLMKLNTSDGNVLIFNAHISDKKLGEDVLPSDRALLKNSYAKFLFDISSEIPSSMFPAAQKSGFAPENASRGMVFNADAETLVRLLNFGSSGAMGESAVGERFQ